ncbi:MAG: NAD(P)H-dependent oxidoreductase subunit E [Syntrophales bacterium]|jgi:NADH-quinone oxidoreductase subunit E|nr:NAD(P)H-dependent oxidoreductase subunit E [Syntrophales bacterium]MCK9528509.1 NAD(P)H-dependent oxidoreductase subunit E [Syntrophales bacterium]MDX9922865.1 NAD(P)H-dependent oxidoreductase subunit E [Syntrophales bacterium]
MDVNNILDIIKKNKGELIAILEEIQQACTYLPETALRLVAEETGRSLVDIYGVATFYKAFSLKPRGNHCVSVCLGTACHVRGAQGIVDEFKQQLGIMPGDTTADNEMSLETVNCLGACALGPTVVVDGRYFPHVTRRKVKEIIAKTREGLEKVDVKTDSRIFPLHVSCPSCKETLMDDDYGIDGHPCIKIDVFSNGKKGWLRLSSLYGSTAIALENDIPLNDVSQFYCPHCLKEIPSFSSCPECGTSMASLFVRDECAWEICTRRGCRGHMLNLDQTKMASSYNM